MDAPNASRESVLELAARPSAYRTLTVIGLALLSAACGLTEPEPPMMRLQGRVLSREDRRPVSARVQLQHAEGDDDWVFTSYTTVVDASTASDASGWYDLEFRAVTCHSFDLRVEAEGFIPFTLERLPCVDGVQTVNVELDPGVCVPDFFGCKWVPPVAVTLLTPAPGVTIRQNDPSIGCPAHPTRGHGFGIRFGWTRSTHAATAAYRLRVKHGTAATHLIDVSSTETEYVSVHCNTFVSDRTLENWTWRVHAVDGAGAPVQSSPEGEFRFEPCRLSSGGACSATDTTRQPSGRILIDASHDGGVWWFPQYGTYDPSVDHQGKRFADYVRSLGYGVDELGRDVVLTDSILDAYSMVIRAGEWGTYFPGELAAYARFLERETTLILLSDHRMTDPQDELSEMLGVTFTGSVTDSITRVAPHPVTGGLLGLRLIGGALVSAFDPERVEILAWVENVPVMGTIQFGRARIIFLGDTNIVQSLPRPFVDHLVTWLVL